MINDLLDYIKDQLETITDITVYLSANDNVEYPATTVLFEDSASEWNTNQTVWRTYTFRVRTVYDLTSETLSVEAVDEKLYNLADSIMDKFDNSRGAGGNADVMEVRTSSCGWLDDNRELRYNDVLLDFRKVRAAG